MANLQNVYFLKYNNYFNKILKKKNTIEDYIAYQVGEVQTDTNFIPGNGISTKHIINYGWSLNDNPDYVVVTDSLNNILSRWFVIDADRTRAGQYSLTLKRDILADEIDNILEAPAFITKATLDDTDPMIFNDEAIRVNQILDSEVLLKDETGVPWIVAYLPKHDQVVKDAQGNVISWEGQTVSSLSSTPNANFTAASKLEFESMLLDGYRVLTGFKARVNVNNKDVNTRNYIQTKLKYANGNFSISNLYPTSMNNRFNITPGNKNFYNILKDGLVDGICQDHGIMENYSTYVSTIEEYNGKTVEIGGVIYRIGINLSTETTMSVNSYESAASNSYLSVKAELEDENILDSVTGNTSSIVYVNEYSYKTVDVALTEIPGVDVNFTISTTRRSLKDQPYDMVCFPYKDQEGNIASIKVNSVSKTYDADAMLGIATNLITTYGSSVVYDVQILPYCPIRDLLNASGEISIINNDIGVKATAIKDGNDNVVGYAFYCYESSATFDIAYTITSSNPKVNHITELYRLSSPNYDGEYEFDPYMNGGVEYFNVDFTYLPYQPWIKINPNYKYLYGKDLNDSRGLICGGNYSIAQMNDAWANYQLNNVNYQNIFDRQIKNMKFNNKWQLIDQAVSSGASALTQGLGIGGLINPIAGIGSGVASALGGGADLYITRQKQKEALGYSKDLYNYNLQNVQALPQTISKVTAFNFNSKYFPFLQVYKTTVEEKTAVENKLRWNGMSVGRIGTLNEFIREEETFIQAEFIRLNINEDYVVASEIYSELQRGIYVKRSDIE